MKTKFILLCAATAALAACAKTEVTPEVLNQDAEITFLTAPVTKTVTKFENTNVFQSAAFYDVTGFSYTSTTSESYIEPTLVKYWVDNNVWKAAASASATEPTRYYWPKDGGKLSFFSWSLNKSDLTFECGVTPTITKDKGVAVTGFSSLDNDDFMVADPALDKTYNETEYTATSGVAAGVPTLFKHQTAQVLIKVRTKEDYTVKPYNQVFTVKAINFIGLKTKGDYTQSTTDGWSNLATSDGTNAASNAYFSGSQVVNYKANLSDAEKVTSTATYSLLPQTPAKDVEKLEVTYNVARGTQNKDYTATVDINKLLGDGVAIEKGKIYVITLTFSLDEIMWDPAVVDWETVDKGEYEIK